jgi:hypothetical protein
MKYIKKFNESVVDYKLTNDVLQYFKSIEDVELKNVISDLENELKKDAPSTDVLMSCADIISYRSDDLKLDVEKTDIIFSEIYDLASKLEDNEDEEEFRNSLPPEEGGPSYKEKRINEFITYLSRINNDESYDFEGRQEDINVLIKKFKNGESLT